MCGEIWLHLPQGSWVYPFILPLPCQLWGLYQTPVEYVQTSSGCGMPEMPDQMPQRAHGQERWRSQTLCFRPVQHWVRGERDRPGSWMEKVLMFIAESVRILQIQEHSWFELRCLTSTITFMMANRMQSVTLQTVQTVLRWVTFCNLGCKVTAWVLTKHFFSFASNSGF